MVLQTMSEITGSAGNEPITRENFKEYARKLPGIEELLTIDINFAVQQEKVGHPHTFTTFAFGFTEAARLYLCS